MKRTCAIVLGVSLFSVSLPAWADGSADAEELFKQGRAALEAKDYATACAKLAESNRLERAVGTMISLAQCYEAQGKLASARANWHEAADFADATNDRLQRGPGARTKFEELDKRVPRLTIVKKAGAPTMTVKRDDTTLGTGSFGSPLPVDPGSHTVTASAEGYAPRSFDLTLVEGEKRTLEVEPGAAVPVATPADAAPSASTSSSSSGDTMRLAGYVVGGAGVVGLGVGTFFGLRASSKWSAAKDGCVPGQCGPDSDAQKNKDDASTAGTLSTVFFLVGGAALATGVALVVLAPSSASRAAIVPAPGGLSAVGRF